MPHNLSVSNPLIKRFLGVCFGKEIKSSIGEIVRRFSGFSTPFGGVTWEPKESEREIIRKLFIALEDRRVLFNPYLLEFPPHVVASVIEIRKTLTDTLSQISESSKAAPSIRLMGAACRRFLDRTQIQAQGFGLDVMALGELRATFGIHLAILAGGYEVDVEGELVSILPETEAGGRSGS